MFIRGYRSTICIGRFVLQLCDRRFISTDIVFPPAGRKLVSSKWVWFALGKQTIYGRLPEGRYSSCLGIHAARGGIFPRLFLSSPVLSSFLIITTLTLRRDWNLYQGISRRPLCSLGSIGTFLCGYLTFVFFSRKIARLKESLYDLHQSLMIFNQLLILSCRTSAWRDGRHLLAFFVV